MFKFLKNKLKTAISKASKKVEEESIPEEIPEEKLEKELIEDTKKEPKKEKKSEEIPIKKKEEEKAIEEKSETEKVVGKTKKKKLTSVETIKEKQAQPIKEVKKEEPKLIKEIDEIISEPVKKEIKKSEEPTKVPEKKSIFSKLKQSITYKITEKQFEDIFDELELILLENNVALEVVDKIKQDLSEDLIGQQIPRKNVENKIQESLKKSIENLFEADQINIVKLSENKKPLIICFVGINGSGKTTTIAKLASMLKKNNKKIVVAASDTFRAAAIQQIEEHTDKLGIKLIKHDYGADAAAVAYDAIKHAQSHDIDIVLIDTAGRLHSNKNLMEEIKKLKRVTKPDLTIFVGESITGNDCIEQAKTFNQEIGIDGIILSKADIDEKGGAAISVSFVTEKPIMFIGTGQEYKDLKEFNSELIVESLGL